MSGLDVSMLFVHRLAGRLLVVDGGPGPWRRRTGLLAGDVRFGAADDRALAMLNVAVGNPWHAPALELLVGPLVLRAEDSLTLAVDGQATIGDDVQRPGRVVRLRRGQRLQVVPGGLGATIVIAGGVGAEPGTCLSRDDAVPLHSGVTSQAAGTFDPFVDDDAPLRVLPGPERGLFDDGAWQALLATTWTVSPLSSRQGLRLEGPALPVPPTELLTAPVWTGAVQVPPSGRPIVLGVDSRTTGGYPRLAHVIAVDRFRLGRARPGAALRFSAIDVDEARAMRRARDGSLR